MTRLPFMQRFSSLPFITFLTLPLLGLACGDTSDGVSNPGTPVADASARVDAPAPIDASGTDRDVAAVDAALSEGGVMDAGVDAALSEGGAMDAGPDGSVAASSADTLTGGNQHTCAITKTGGVACWGSNVDGQVGDATTTPVHFAPFSVPGLTGVRSLTSGRDHTCALLGDGTVRCWGINSNGELGDGTKLKRTGPVAVVGLTDAVEVRSFWAYTCARRVGGGIRCWGGNSGAFGDGTVNNSATPVDTSGITSATSLGVGWGHTCAVVAGATVKCWGHYNHWGQIGDGTTALQQLLPVSVVQLANVTAVTNGSYHSCARLADSTVKCWGNNQSGNLGLGSSDSNRHTATAVPGLTGVDQVTGGSGHTCARLSTKEVRCWGYGPIGDGVHTSMLSPTAVVGLTDAIEIASGEDHACARRANGKIVCWGSDYGGQLGDDNVKLDKLAPVEVVGLP